jgi:hypothetical protein
MPDTDPNSVSSAVAGARERLRLKRGPFLAIAGRPLLVHCSHHKVGTVWFKRVLEVVAKTYGLHFENVGPNKPSADTEMFVFNNAFRFKREYLEGRRFRGSHIIRDPRDLAVSAYHYHLRTTEQWVVTPSERWGGTSYQDYLKSLSAHDGLLAEIDRCARSEFKSMGEWDYKQPEFLELRYEEVMQDESSAFERLFRHYRFRHSVRSTSVEIARGFSLDVVGGGNDSHVRSGRPGEWRDVFEPEHTAEFKKLTGDLAVRLGYETSPDW